MNSIKCPSCNFVIPLSEVISKEIESEVIEKERKKYASEMEITKNQILQRTNNEIELLREKIRQKEERLKKSEEAEINLRKERLLLEEEKEHFQVEKARELDRERETIKKKTADEIEKRNHLEKMELEKKISDLKKLLEDAQRKATQGSQQLQGEIQELDLEQLLGRSFPHDQIEAIGKGVAGADIRQIVKTSGGSVCGIILWESKRTKFWSDQWLQKLKQDLLSDKANIPAIITEALPPEAHAGIGLKDGVWIASPTLALMLALLLRSRLLEVARQKQIVGKQQSKADQLYLYITSHDFQHQVESMLDTYREMKNQLDREKAAFERSWKMREMQIGRLVNGVAGIYGSMQGIAEKALPTISGLDLPSENIDEKLL